MADRTTLETWIAETERNKDRLHKALPFASIVAVALLFASRPVGLGAVMLVALVAVYGHWIMSSHIVDWRQRIADLDKPKPVGRAIKRR
jgi:hypothetical protein